MLRPASAWEHAAFPLDLDSLSLLSALPMESVSVEARKGFSSLGDGLALDRPQRAFLFVPQTLNRLNLC